MENSILVAKPTSCHRAQKISHNTEATRKSLPHINICSRSKHASKHRPLMIPLLGNVVENKKITTYESFTQDRLCKMHTRFRSCSHQPSVAEVYVGEERRSRFPQLGHTSQPQEYRSLVPSRDQCHEQAPRRRVISTTPLPVSTRTAC